MRGHPRSDLRAGARALLAALCAAALVACGGGGTATTAGDASVVAAEPTAAGGADEGDATGTATSAATVDVAAEGLEAFDDLEGAEREQALLDCASQEDPLLWYTVLIEDQLARPMVDAFQERYPQLTAQLSRTNSSGVIDKMVTESRAGRIESDVWSATDVMPLKEADLIQPYSFPTAADYSEDFRDPDGTWVASNVYTYSPAYNTSAVPAEEAPQTFEDLLDPRWSGRMAWTTSDLSGWTGFVGNVMTSMGEDDGRAYLEQLAQQDIAPLEVSARQVVDQVIAGEYDIGLQIFNHHTVISAAEGAPVDWIPMEPLMVSANPTGITKGATSPCAAALFMDFQLSEEGQVLFREADYLPAHPDVEAKEPSLIPQDAGLEYTVISPQDFDAGRDAWNALINELFR